MKMLGKVGQKCLAVALLAAILLPLIAGGTWLHRMYAEGEDERRVLLERFDRARGIVAYVATDSHPQQADQAVNLFLGDGTPAVVTADLQSRLREIASLHGVDVLQASDLKPEVSDGIAKLGIRLELHGPAAGVHALLEEINKSVPWLFADEFQIASGYTDGQVQQFEPPLSIALDVYGLRPADQSGIQP